MKCDVFASASDILELRVLHVATILLSQTTSSLLVKATIFGIMGSAKVPLSFVNERPFNLVV